MTTIVEQWKPVVGYEGIYEVSDQGRVRTLPHTVIRKNGSPCRVRGRDLKPYTLGPYGHRALKLEHEGVRKGVQVHRLVLAAFVGPCPPGMEACHNDGDAGNNRLSNLRWDTPSANQQDRIRHGNHHNANKTHCPHGHEYTPENIYWHIRPPGGRYRTTSVGRQCKTCTLSRPNRRKAAA